MATVIGIFENHYLKKNLCLLLNQELKQGALHIKIQSKYVFMRGKIKFKSYSISNKESFSILQVAKLFNSKIKFVPARKGERFASLTNLSLSSSF